MDDSIDFILTTRLPDAASDTEREEFARGLDMIADFVRVLAAHPGPFVP